MEPALPPLHPLMPELLENLKLRVVDVIKWNVIACTELDNPEPQAKWVIKVGVDERKAEGLAYETRILRDVLPAIDQSEFERLVLPEYVDDGVFNGVQWLRTVNIPGKRLVHEWSELVHKPEFLGGRGMDQDVARLAIDLLRDLRSVDISVMPDFVRRFNFAKWFDEFRVRSEQLVSGGFMEKATVSAATELFSSKHNLRYEGSIFTNGDFYPRNFIILPGGNKVALVDWVGSVDPWEFVAMRAWLLMWGSPRWQIEYARGIKNHFPVDLEEMRIGMLVGAFDLAYRWREEPEEDVGFARTQMLAYFRQCLDISYVNSVFT